jgi:hypothetical protein
MRRFRKLSREFGAWNVTITAVAVVITGRVWKRGLGHIEEAERTSLTL